MSKKQHYLLASISLVPWLWILQVDVGPNRLVTTGVKLLVFCIIFLLTFGVLSFSWDKLLSPRLEKPSWRSLVQLIILWAFLELALSWLVAIIWIGRNGSWDTILPFASVTPLIMQTPLRFISRLTGFFGTSSMIVIGILILLRGKPWRHIAIYFWLCIVASTTILYITYSYPSGTRHTVTIVAEMAGDKFPIPIAQSELVLLPEYGLDGVSKTGSERIIGTGKEIYFSGSKHNEQSRFTQNVLVYGSTKQGTQNEIPKTRLIPGGEYLPPLVSLLFMKTSPTTYAQFSTEKSVTKGQGTLDTPHHYLSDLTLGNAVCSSIISSRDYRRLTANGATVLGNSASLATFRNSSLVGMFFDSFAKFMATANARPFIQSSSNWRAFAIDQNGRQLTSIAPTHAKEVVVQINSQKTPYTYLGEWLSVVGGVYLLYLLTRSGVRRVRTK